MPRARILRRFVPSLVLAVVLVGGTAQAVVPLEPVVTGRAQQFFGFANDDYLVHSHWTKATGEKALAKPLTGGAYRRLNAAGTQGTVGGIDPGTNRVILQQWTRRGSALFFYDLDTDRRSKVPGVNSRAWEWAPRISSRFIVFQRDRYRRGAWYTTLLVFNRETGRTRTLGTWKARRDWHPVVLPNSAGDRYVTYTRCTRKLCGIAYLYDWVTKTHRKIPTVSGRLQWAPAVDEVNSTVYFIRGGNLCGRNVAVWRLPISLAGAATKIAVFGRGIDAGWPASLTPNGTTGLMDLYVDRWHCAQRNEDIYVARGVDAGPVPPEEPPPDEEPPPEEEPPGGE